MNVRSQLNNPLTVLFVVASALTSLGAVSAYERETDVDSLRRSQLGTVPDSSVIHTDLDDDGDPDILELWWQGKRLRWFDENDVATEFDQWGDMVNGALQVDMDGDGFYDGPSDYNVKWADRDGDGVPDIQVFNSNPQVGSVSVFGASQAVWYVTIDPENSGVLVDIEWGDLSVSWTRLNGGPNWRPNYHGNATFLKEHAPIWSVEDPEYSWENPFLFYDPDHDGLSEMSIRTADNRQFYGERNNQLRFDGIYDDVWLSYDLDNDSGRGNEMDYDLTLYVAGGSGYDYSDEVHDYPELRAPDWALDYYRHSEWRQLTRFRYIDRLGAVEKLFAADWGRAFLTVDEDDDCHRWERVELYYPGDPYRLERRTNSMITHPQSDTLGDRGEWDADFSGRGKLYRAAWDGKIHLYGAERGAWTVDRNAEFWGAAHPNGKSSEKMATVVEEVVQYYDTDRNGFLDKVTFDYDGDGVVDRTDSLLELGIDDRGPFIDVVKSDWNALRLENAAAAKENWSQAQRLFRLAMRYGLADQELIDLSKASSLAQKESQAYWLRETLIRDLRSRLSPDQYPVLMKAYYRGDLITLEEVFQSLRNKG